MMQSSQLLLAHNQQWKHQNNLCSQLTTKHKKLFNDYQKNKKDMFLAVTNLVFTKLNTE